MMKFLKEFIDEKRNGGDISFFDFSEFSNLEKIDKRNDETFKKANWENRSIAVVLKNLNNSEITESDFEDFINKV
jgi:hypothetical protein